MHVLDACMGWTAMDWASKATRMGKVGLDLILVGEWKRYPIHALTRIA